MNQNNLEEFRCSCGKLLFKGDLSSSVVEIKCKKCGKVQSFSANPKVVCAEINSAQNTESQLADKSSRSQES